MRTVDFVSTPSHRGYRYVVDPVRSSRVARHDPPRPPPVGSPRSRPTVEETEGLGPGTPCPPVPDSVRRPLSRRFDTVVPPSSLPCARSPRVKSRPGPPTGRGRFRGSGVVKKRLQTLVPRTGDESGTVGVEGTVCDPLRPIPQSGPTPSHS